MPVARKRLIAIVLAVALVLSLVIAAASSGLGDPSVPKGDIAIVEDVSDGGVTSADFDLAISQQAMQAQLKTVPKPSSPQYEQLKTAALNDVLLSRWVRGEAEEQGIEITDREIDTRLDDVAKQQFGGTKGFEQFLKTSGFCTDDELKTKPLVCQGARDRIELQAITDELQKNVLDDLPKPSSSEISDYYDANIAMFQTPETRDVRLVLNTDEAKLDAAKKALDADDSDASWAKVAKKYSTDTSTSASGGLRQAVVEGQSGDPEFDKEVFGADPKTVVGPFKGQGGSYVIEVDKVTAAATTPLSQASDQISQTLTQSEQQLAATRFQDEFLSKWRARTFCGSDYLTDRCSNFEAAPAGCSYDVADPADCGDAPVLSTRPVEPGTAGVIGAGAPAFGLPQGPHGVVKASAAAATGLPAGLVPGTTGATGAAGATGTVPQGSVPQQVPQGSVPQQVPQQVPQGSVPQQVPQQTAPSSP